LPEVHTELKKLRKVADENDAVLIGETYTSNRDELKEYYGDHNDEIQLPMDFMFCEVNKLSLATSAPKSQTPSPRADGLST